MSNIKDADCVVIAVAHNEFREMSLEDIDLLFKKCDNSEKVIIDVKSIIDKEKAEKLGYRYWRL